MLIWVPKIPFEGSRRLSKTMYLVGYPGVLVKNQRRLERKYEMHCKNIDDLYLELRNHPDCCAVILWREDAARAIGADPIEVDWQMLEERSIEMGWDIITRYSENYM